MRRRLFVIALIGWLMNLAASGVTEAANNTVATALHAVLGENRSQTLTTPESGYYVYRLYAHRSYVAFCWPASMEGGASNGSCWPIFVDANDAQLAPVVCCSEPHPDGGMYSTYTPSVSTRYYVRLRSFTALPVTMHLIVLDTTLASPWYFVSPSTGYESYVEIRNQTADVNVSVTVRAYNSAGTIVGSTTVSVPANGNTFVRVGADLGVAPGSGSVTITHDRLPGAIVANTTALSATTGLSFDAPFTPRMVWSMF